MVLRCFPEVYRHALSLQFYNRLTYDCAAFYRFGNKHSRLAVLTLLLLFNPSLTFYNAKPICFVTTTIWLLDNFKQRHKSESDWDRHAATKPTNTNTHTTELPRWPSIRKVKPIWILLKQETVSGSGISWAICKHAPCSRQLTHQHPTTQFFTGQMPFLPPNQQRQSTEGTQKVFDNINIHCVELPQDGILKAVNVDDVSVEICHRLKE